jgi:RND family efflux transporter MFP subunit
LDFSFWSVSVRGVLFRKLAVLALISVVGLAGCKSHSAQDPLTADPLVAVATVASAVGGDGQYTGVVGARIQSDLGFRVSGKVIERLVDTGQRVTKGQALMRMDPTDYTHALVAQTGNVGAARARWIQAAADERRNFGLVETGAISQSAYDQVKAAADSAKALLDAAVAQQQLARNQEDYSLLVADADGTVMQTRAEPGQVVAPGQVVIQLAHAGHREAIVNLPESLRPSIGSVADAGLYGDSVRVAAKLRQLSDAADPVTRTFEARYVMDGAGAIAPLGATVTIRIDNDDAAKQLSVPLGAIDDEGHGPGVWLVDANTSKVSYRSVQIHSLGAESVEIQGDLAPGTRIVATGGHYLHEGEKIRVTSLQAAMQ